MNSTPVTSTSTIRLTALLPAPPTPTTMILQAGSVSFVLISSTVGPSLLKKNIHVNNNTIEPRNNQWMFKIFYKIISR
jgi:hypothetical protein